MKAIIELREDDKVELKDGIAYPTNPDDLAFFDAWVKVLEQKEKGASPSHK